MLPDLESYQKAALCFPTQKLAPRSLMETERPRLFPSETSRRSCRGFCSAYAEDSHLRWARVRGHPASTPPVNRQGVMIRRAQRKPLSPNRDQRLSYQQYHLCVAQNPCTETHDPLPSPKAHSPQCASSRLLFLLLGTC